MSHHHQDDSNDQEPNSQKPISQAANSQAPDSQKPNTQAMNHREIYKLAKQGPYPSEAFLFVQRGLDFTVKQLHGDLTEQMLDEMPEDPTQSSRHVSGQQLCLGLRDFARQQYGMLARTVLRRWRITSSEDFGRIVFLMVEAGIMHKTDEDTFDDFVNVFRIDESFCNESSMAE